MQSRSIGLLFLVSFFMYSAEASLQCYSCISRMGLGMQCETPSKLPERQHFDCNFANAVCAKYVIRDRYGEILHRHCTHFDICSKLGYEYNTPYTSLLECNTCANKDLCNSASHNYTFYSVLLIIAIVIKNLFL